MKKKIANLPEKTGIYFFKNTQGEVIYIGKARSLRNRVKSYFLKTSDSKIKKIIAETNDLDFILTDSEREAAFLENNYIREYQPKFNIRLKDDKSFPYLKLTLQDRFPGIYLTRRVESDGSRYYGPFSPAHQARVTIHLLAKNFGIRTCKETIPGKRKRPCLEYDLKLCSAPCVDFISETVYRDSINNTRMFLEGKVQELRKILAKKMSSAAQQQKYEQAAIWRDFLQTLKQIEDKPKLITVKPENEDIFGFARKGNSACIYVFIRRNGRVIASESHRADIPEGMSDSNFLKDQVLEFYSHSHEIPDTVLIPFQPAHFADMNNTLSRSKGQNVRLHIPIKGKKKKLVELADRNAKLVFDTESQENPAVIELQNTLALPDPPSLIEGFDISNTSGEESVGSLVIFENGMPNKNAYRRYIIRTVNGPNDVASLEEVIFRRYKKVIKENQSMPDLILVDGGKGQLHAANNALYQLGIRKQPVAAIAKKEEKIFTSLYKNGLLLESTSPALKLLQHVRNEAHRFAITLHRRRREKRSFSSFLDDVPGIGKKRKELLLSHYKNINAILSATHDELAKVVGSIAAQNLLKKIKSP